MNPKQNLLQKIEESKAVIGIIGLGYVGLPLAVNFATGNLKVIGFDKSSEKTAKINRSENYIKDVKDNELNDVVTNDYLNATTEFSKLVECDAIIICVPTPLDVFKKPDMHFIESACSDIGANMKSGTFICLESTTYPTTTENFILPLLEKSSGLKHGKEFWLAYSPERVDPGNKQYQTRNTPKILGALTNDGLEIGSALYKKAVDEIHTVSSPRVAEMVKILENTYRLVNISLINEIALLCGKMDINIWEVVEAAATKPYGFQAFYPGPGVGGHCIPLDPFYLEHIAKKFGFDLSMINAAGHINNMMAHRMTIKITSALNRQKKAINGSRILILGVAYKPNIDDARESPALKIIDQVFNKGGEVFYHDPFIHEIITDEGHKFSSIEFNEDQLKKADCVVIATNHNEYKADLIVEHSKLIVDLRNLIKEASDKVYKL